MPKNRRTERKPMFRVCRYNIEGRDYADLSTNISPGGIFIKNFSPPPVGTPIILTVKLPSEWGNQPLKILGRVAHVNQDQDPHNRGMGVEFTTVVADSMPIIEYFVQEVFPEEKHVHEQLKESSPGGDVTTYEYHISKKGPDKA